MDWNLYEGKKLLEPLQYSNGKSQLDIVNCINDGFGINKFVLLDGICGTGKSPIALHCCANFGKSIIVVPTKHLQDQYQRDYTKKMRVFDLKIQFLKGRSNFKCNYEDNKIDCNHPSLPCITRMKGDEKRYEMCKCNFWSPIYPPEIAQKMKDDRENVGIKNIEMKKYMSASGQKIQVVRTPSCNYHKQYFSFWDDTNVIVMNDKIWELMIMKKPTTELEVIDEYDEYFDSLYFDEILGFSKLSRFYPKEEDAKKGGDAMMDLYRRKTELAYKMNDLVKEADENALWSYLGELREFFYEVLKQHDDIAITNFVERLDVCLSNKKECDIEFETNRMFGDDASVAHVIMPNPFVVIEKIFKNSNRVLLMSATPHSENVLKDFFKITPNIIRGETKQPGTLFLVKTDMKYVNHREWAKEDFKKEYYDAYRNIIKSIPKNERTLIQSPSLKYSGVIAKEFGINVDSSQSDFYGNRGVFSEWLRGDFKTLISTKCKRGVDLKDDLCRNIVIDKMPYPDKNDRKFKSIEKRFPLMFNEIYNDIAKRSLIQMIARGLRHKDDWVRVYTPDLMVYDKIKKLNVFRIKEVDLNSVRTNVQSSLMKSKSA
ncbi:MAG: helicase C-terminal domain-containing protein [Candidatus Aenigmatarchaeota archaeon]